MAKEKKNELFEKIVSLAKRRGFVYPGSEIYGGLQNSYDFGPLGVELKNNIKNLWWKFFVQDRDNMVGIDGAIMMNSKVWEASGHTKGFNDTYVECKKCHKRFRPDKLEKSNKCPECGGEFTTAKEFNCMFKTDIGPVVDEGSEVFLRPETAQAMFVDFKSILDTTNKKIPFGIAQMGKAFRNEITSGQFIFRTLEFEQMEIEYFIAPPKNDAEWNKVFEYWLEEIYKYADLIGLDRKNFYNHEIGDDDRAHYSKRTIDLEFQFPFGQDELWAIAYRTDYDLKNHEKHSGQDLKYFDDQAKKKYIPHVIEPTFGVGRTVLAVLAQAYTEEKDRVVLKIDPKIAPYKVAVAPLLGNKPELAKEAKKVYDQVKTNFHAVWDDRGNIGKRYKSQDEIGTPFFVVFDFDSLEDKAVTVRDRDSMKQERIKISKLVDYLSDKLK